jgi:hypothetical protein
MLISRILTNILPFGLLKRIIFEGKKGLLLTTAQCYVTLLEVEIEYLIVPGDTGESPFPPDPKNALQGEYGQVRNGARGRLAKCLVKLIYESIQVSLMH